MAKHAIFNQTGDFLNLAESDSEKDSLIAYSYPTHSTKEISDQLFADVANSQKFISLDGDSITETTRDVAFTDETAEEQKKNFEHEIGQQINRVENFISNHSTHSDLSIWQDYLSKLQNIDVESISFPVSNNSFQQWFNSQSGHPSKNIFQLP